MPRKTKITVLAVPVAVPVTVPVAVPTPRLPFVLLCNIRG